jgi:hypothetical protein
LGRLNPFRIKAEERKEIRQVALIYFDGGNPAAMEETAERWQKSKKFFEIFAVCKDARYGNLLHLPFSGGVYEQPAKTMNVIEEIQNAYIEKLAEKMKGSFSGIQI